MVNLFYPSHVILRPICSNLKSLFQIQVCGLSLKDEQIKDVSPFKVRVNIATRKCHHYLSMIWKPVPYCLLLKVLNNWSFDCSFVEPPPLALCEDPHFSVLFPNFFKILKCQDMNFLIFLGQCYRVFLCLCSIFIFQINMFCFV